MIDYAHRYETPEECAAEVRRHYRARLAEFFGCCVLFVVCSVALACVCCADDNHVNSLIELKDAPAEFLYPSAAFKNNKSLPIAKVVERLECDDSAFECEFGQQGKGIFRKCGNCLCYGGFGSLLFGDSALLGQFPLDGLPFEPAFMLKEVDGSLKGVENYTEEDFGAPNKKGAEIFEEHENDTATYTDKGDNNIGNGVKTVGILLGEFVRITDNIFKKPEEVFKHLLNLFLLSVILLVVEIRYAVDAWSKRKNKEIGGRK